MILYIITVASSYLIASIPFGLILCKSIHSVDIRNIGSKNIGATNVTRQFGKKLGFTVFFLDFVKGLLPTLITHIIFKNYALTSIVGIICSLAHCFPIYLKFKGGKAVSTTISVFVTFSPILFFLSIITWLLSYKITKVSGKSALFMALISPIYAFIIQSYSNYSNISNFLFPSVLFLSILILVRHHSNILKIVENNTK